MLPGASSEDEEKLVTDPLEEAIRKVQDIKFVSGTSREGSVGTFWLLSASGQTLHQNILLGVVIVLGMLVDDVVVEAIYYRIQRGAESLQAVDALKEDFTPVTASVTTTMAAFLPLMLMPGNAARRRVVPILITSLTTIAGLFSLAAGLAGESLIWGPVASAIVWGLVFSTILTLFVIPLLYRTFIRQPTKTI